MIIGYVMTYDVRCASTLQALKKHKIYYKIKLNKNKIDANKYKWIIF